MAAPVKQLSDGNPGGSGLGQSTTDLISFYGATPVSQRASSIQAASVVSATRSSASQAIWQRGRQKCRPLDCIEHLERCGVNHA
jgi:hypothetical protein